MTDTIIYTVNKYMYNGTSIHLVILLGSWDVDADVLRPDTCWDLQENKTTGKSEAFTCHVDLDIVSL